MARLPRRADDERTTSGRRADESRYETRDETRASIDDRTSTIERFSRVPLLASGYIRPADYPASSKRVSEG